MEYEKYIVGVGPNGIDDIYELKILICYVMKSVGEPLKKEQIANVFQANLLSNFFEFSSCFDDLIKTGHITQTDEKETFFKVTVLGEKTAEVLEKILPKTVRDSAVKSTLDLLLKSKTNSSSTVKIIENNDKFIVDCKISDFSGDLIEIKLLVPDKMQGEFVKTNFLNNSKNVYQGLLALLTGDNVLIKNLLNNEKNK